MYLSEMRILTAYNDIDRRQWQRLTDESPVATWFQSPEAYDFFASLPALMTPFVFAVGRKGPGGGDEGGVDRLTGVVAGYVTRENNYVKQYFTRRAIIYGGPLLAEDISDEELHELLSAVVRYLSSRAIYIETRNFNDYSRCRPVFERCGFRYQPHLNFHVDTTSVELAQTNIGKHRWKYIRLSMRDGANMVENPTIEQVQEFYDVLVELYRTKVHTPLYPWIFFEKLYSLPSTRYLLVEFDGKIVGGTCCVSLDNKALYEWFVCGNDNYHKGIRPSSVATWFGMKYAAEHGYPRFDLMGAGKPDEPYGVRDFKAEFGGQLVEHGRWLFIPKPLLYYIGKLGVKLLKLYNIK